MVLAATQALQANLSWKVLLDNMDWAERVAYFYAARAWSIYSRGMLRCVPSCYYIHFYSLVYIKIVYAFNF